MKNILESEVKCPHCNFTKVEGMPENNCQIIYICENCNEKLTPKNGDCCIFCTYGTVPCPPIQENKRCS